VRERADLGLRARDFQLGRRRAAVFAQRAAVGPGVVADPVAFRMRPLGAGARVAACELVADHEEGGAHAAARQHVEHARGDRWLRPVVERHGQVEHAPASRGTVERERTADQRDRF
jgi:hypothetical protein